MVPKQRRPPCLCGGGPDGPKAREAPLPMRRSPTLMRWGPRFSNSEGGPLAHAVGASVIQSEGGPRAHAAGAPRVPKAKEGRNLNG